MASPQPDKFTKLSNELLEALMTVKMSGSEWQFIMCLFRKTYGYNKTEDWITGSQIVKATGMKKERVSEAKKRLLERKIVTEKRNKLSIQKDYDLWVELRKNVTGVTEKRNKVLRKNVNTKEKKETIQKTLAEPSSGALKTNHKNMGFQKYSDDYEEELQIEPDYKTKKKEEKKKVSDDIQAVFDLFSNPAKVTWRMREIERVSAQALFDTYGLETLEKRITRIEKEKKENAYDPYFPIVNTPSQLLDKMENVERYIKQTS